ncbi:hypothetical protein Q7P37_007544 [Cladosporium fusiforme]
MQATQDASSLLELPAELLYQILSYLTPLDIARVACTCHQLCSQSYDDRLWQLFISQNLPRPITEPTPLKRFRELYIAHHPHWFLPKRRIWFADSEPNGKLLIARYDQRRGCIEAYAVTAVRGQLQVERWEKDTNVIIHNFDPKVSLDLNQPVLKLDVSSLRTDDQPDTFPCDRDYAPPSRYSKETVMETFAESGLYGSFMLTRKLPANAIGPNTSVWPPLRFPAHTRVRNDSADGYSSAGHRPSTLAEVSKHNFRLRKWVEYTGRRSSPRIMSFNSPNGLSATMGSIPGNYFTGGGMSVRMPEDITTYAALPEESYKPTKEKPWQGIWCGDYSGHGCEFLVILQPDAEEEKPLPSGMEELSWWFRGERRRGSSSTDSSFASAQEEFEAHVPSTGEGEAVHDGIESERGANYAEQITDVRDAPTGRLEAIKLTGDPNIPRAEYTFVAPDVGHGGLVRIADEELFRGARVVRSAGHIAQRGFRDDQYTPSQLIMISENRLAQFWEGFGHISYYQRVDLDKLMQI